VSVNGIAELETLTDVYNVRIENDMADSDLRSAILALGKVR
jgi:hypothetical protein